MSTEIPVIDLAALYSASPSAQLEVAKEIYDAFHSWGFCTLVGHNVSVPVQESLRSSATEFFALPGETKREFHVKQGGVAWRGYMPLGGEGTHGRVDAKEGIYFGPEHPDDHPHTGLPLHGKNQFPDASIPAMRPAVLEYIAQITSLGKLICGAVSLGLGLEQDYIEKEFLTPEPVALFRCFKYSSELAKEGEKNVWGIGEHTDFGLLTILKQDSPGLQVFSPTNEWVDVPVVENGFVCSVGDMLDMMSNGRLKSARHRVLPPPPGTYRLSFPFFFDFSWTAKMHEFPLPPVADAEAAEARERWAQTTFKGVSGEWWQYLAKKVMKVFPDLALPDFEHNSTPSTRFTLEVPTSI